MKDASTEWERFRPPRGSFYHCLAVGIEEGEICTKVVGKMVSPECVHDERVRNAAKGILEIKESDVCRSLVLPRTLNDLFHHNVVLYAPVDARQEGLLHAGVHQLVCDEI